MKRIFSVPPQTESTEDQTGNHPSPSSAPLPAAPRASVYVRQVTDQHQNAIARILARVRSHPQDQSD